MTQTKGNCYFLPTAAAEALMTESVGRLTPVLIEDNVAEPFTALDCFDQSLRRSGRLLLATRTRLSILTVDGGTLSQPSHRKGRFVATFREGPVKDALSDLSPLRCLLPIESGNLRQVVLGFVDSDHQIHCRAHLHILTGTGGQSAVLVTLQGLHGYGKSFANLHRRVEACGGGALDFESLYADIFPGLIGYKSKPKVVIKPKDTAFKAANDIIDAYIPVARANEVGIIADYDTEFLHDYRIALRKIRSVLSLFKGVYAKGQTADLKLRFSEMMAPTGRLRDLDVHLLEKQQYFDFLPTALHDGLDRMFAMFAVQRKAEKAKLARHMRSRGYKNTITDLANLFAKRKKLRPGPNADLAAHDFARALIWKRYRRICKIAAGIGPDTDESEVHDLRIHCKKLRYLMEFFAHLFPRPAFNFLIKPLKHLQDNLGRINDYAVQQISLQDFLRRVSRNPDGESQNVGQSVGALILVLQQRQLEERAKVVERFARFNSPKTQATFRALFHDRDAKK